MNILAWVHIEIQQSIHWTYKTYKVQYLRNLQADFEVENVQYRKK